MINLFDFIGQETRPLRDEKFIAVDKDDKLLSQTDFKKKVNKLELKEIQDLTSQIDQELNRLYKASTLSKYDKRLFAVRIEFLQTLRKIVEKRAMQIFKESLK